MIHTDQYSFVDGKVVFKDNNLIAYDISTWEPEIVSRMKAMLAIQRDLDYAEAYLNQMFFSEGTTLVDGALINSAIQLLIKCFTCSRGSRLPLDEVRVFRKFANQIGESDLVETYKAYAEARNRVISHDQDGYKDSGTGLIVDQRDGKAVSMMGYSIKTTYLYKQNQQTVLKLVKIAQQFVNQQKTEIETKLVEKYNSEKPELTELGVGEIKLDNAW